MIQEVPNSKTESTLPIYVQQIDGKVHARMFTAILLDGCLMPLLKQADSKDSIHALLLMKYWKEQLPKPSIAWTILVPLQQPIYESVGFKFVAEVGFYSAKIPKKQQPLKFNWVKHRDMPKGEFDRIYYETMANNLDFPELAALVPMEKSLRGYQGSAPDKNYWFGLERDGQFVGCVILSSGKFQKPSICYLGLIPGVRGQRWGHDVVRDVLEIARAKKFPDLHVHVDQRNLPALRIYTKNEFRSDGVEPMYLLHHV
jgi:ribosomal protein S18 acetylase RimI-like enzyme